ncbi:tRNA (guanosine(37)-N1)-methyltransferase TrmD [Patescibacteria group bacterium]
MTYYILTIFPDIFASYVNESILKRAQEKRIIKIKPINFRDYTADKHKTVDDKPYGGGTGMVMKVDPIYKALKNLKRLNGKSRIILLTPQGKKFSHKIAQRLSKYENVVFVCGRYEGIDARVEKFVDEKISIGDYVVTGGELPAMVMIDSITRLLPGVLGNKNSIKEESHSSVGMIEYPQYTRPEVFEADGKKIKVPKVLLSGDHKKIAEWRGKNMKKAK